MVKSWAWEATSERLGESAVERPEEFSER